MTPIRLIATDLDGTLLRDDGSISERTRRAIGGAQAAGLTVVFVTARPPRDVHAIADHLGITGMAICSNGAIVHDLATGETHRHERLCQDLARSLVSELRLAEPGVAFATEHGHRLGQEAHFPDLFADTVHHHARRIDDAAALCGEVLTKLLVHHPDHHVEHLATRIRGHLGDRGEVIWSGAPFVEIAPSGVSKASGLASLCALLDLSPAEVIAFGDMPNDVPMLGYAGRGVAVSNAHPEVLAAADEVTASNEDDGVARVIESLLA